MLVQVEGTQDTGSDQTLSKEVKRFYPRCFSAILGSLVVATGFALFVYYLSHPESREGDGQLSDAAEWASNWHRTVGRGVDALTVGPGIATVVLAVWVANALSSPIDDERAPLKERARHLMLDHVTVATTFGGAVVLWTLVMIAGFREDRLVGSCGAALLAIFCSALTPLAQDRADAHRLTLEGLERRRQRLSSRAALRRPVGILRPRRWHSVGQVLSSTGRKLMETLTALGWRMPVFVTVTTVIVVLLNYYVGGTRHSWWRVSIAVGSSALLQWTWTTFVLTSAALLPVQRASRGWAFLLTYVQWAMLSIVTFMTIAIGVLTSTRSWIPFFSVLFCYFLPLGTLVHMRQNNQLQRLAALYGQREATILDKIIAEEKKDLSHAGSAAAGLRVKDVSELFREVHGLEANFSQSGPPRYQRGRMHETRSVTRRVAGSRARSGGLGGYRPDGGQSGRRS